MPRFGKETDNIDIPYDSIPASDWRHYSSYDKLNIFKKSATELYIQHEFKHPDQGKSQDAFQLPGILFRRGFAPHGVTARLLPSDGLLQG